MSLAFPNEHKFCFKLIVLFTSFLIQEVNTLDKFNNITKADGIENDRNFNQTPPEVQLESGTLIGTYFETAKGRRIFSFLEIPYAAPPINEFRFKEPQPVVSWDGKKEANKKNKKCWQIVHHKMAKNEESILGGEDCLHLDVYTPKLHEDNETELLDVILFIHGGAFMYGSGHIYTPKYLLDEMDLVFVSIDYRLGPFGFLTMDDEIIPGNNGLKDQAYALKWVKNNIKQFSGDPNKVTISGMSAGGASVNLHYLSKTTRNLFSKGISVSGVATNPWALMEGGKNKTIQLAESLNCKTNSSITLLKCLQEKSAYEILKKVKDLFMPWLYNPFTPFGPTVELAGNEPFLDENPYKMHLDGKSKDAPWLVSITSGEGLYPGAEFVDNNTLIKELNNNWYDIAPHLLDFNYTAPLNKQNRISKMIREYYFANKEITINSSKQLTDVLGDRLFLKDIGNTAKLQAISTKSNVFMYRFSFRGTHSVSSSLSRSNKNLGISHGDDLPYVLGCFYKQENKEEKEMVNKMVQVWTSFIKHGTPDTGNEVTWYPVSKSRGSKELQYLNIKSFHEMNMVTENNFGNKNFWDTLPFKENILAPSRNDLFSNTS